MTAFNQAWDILKMRFKDFQGKAKGMQDDIKHRYAKEHSMGYGDSNTMPFHEQETVNQSIVDRLVHDKMQENMQQGRVGEQTTDALASNKPLFVPRYDARTIDPRFTVRQDIQDEMPYSFRHLYTENPPVKLYNPEDYSHLSKPTLTEKDMEMLRRFDTNNFDI